MVQTIRDIEDVLVMRHNGECVVPHKVVLRKGTQAEESVSGRINALPGYLGGDKNIGGMKWVGGKLRSEPVQTRTATFHLFNYNQFV